MRKLLIFSLFISLIIMSPTSACDVNLFAIISGSNNNDTFSEDMKKLAMVTKDMGLNVANHKKAQEMLQDLMNRWLAFSNSFSQTPPDWAKADKEWQKKFSLLADIIGQIRRNLVTDALKAHAMMLKFSRRLPQLYITMPMEPQAKGLLGLAESFDLVWDAFFAKNAEELKLQVAELKKRCLDFQKIVAEEYRPDARLLHEYVEQLRIMTRKPDVFANDKLEPLITAAEANYVLMNEHISGNKSETAPATPTDKKD
ncbi:MAG: hypothetical protein PHD82_08480 [Candidatus Riflebacteria bacterium]|jgi:hypothetical protein|nr:hypothetical protein [Candidatus Riflebacteria bacterium]